MQFRQHQTHAQRRSWQLWLAFAILVVLLTATVNAVLALLYKAIIPASFGYPNLFFETNSALVLMFVLGGAWVENHRLRDGGGARVARWLGAQLVRNASDPLEQRLLNVVSEMALASGQAVPAVYVMPRETSINGFVAGWGHDDVVMIVTRGALERLNRAELQGLVAHEFGHIKEEDLPLNMRALALVWGLSLLHGYGQQLTAPDELGHRNPLLWPVGMVLRGLGWLGWLCGRLLQASLSRQREYLADACAVQFTRSKDGIGNVLRKVWHDQVQSRGHLQHPSAQMVAAMLLHEPVQTRLFACHPPLPERIQRIFGAPMAPLATRRTLPPAPHAKQAEVAQVTQALTSDHLAPLSVPFSAPPSLTDGPGLLNLQPVTHVPTSHPSHTQQEARDAQQRLHRLGGPREQRLLLLALMLDLRNAHELRWWEAQAAGLVQGAHMLTDVQALPANWRMPEFERVANAIARMPVESRRQVVQEARNLLRADGRISPRDRLWWLSLRHRLHRGGDSAAVMMPMHHHQADLHNLPNAERTQVAMLSAYLARFVPMAEREDGVHPAAQVWFDQVMQRCGDHCASAVMPIPPDADGLVHALTSVQELSWMVRALLVKAWVEEAVNHSPNGLLSDDTADALRMCAALLDTPMPSMLEAHYRTTP